MFFRFRLLIMARFRDATARIGVKVHGGDGARGRCLRANGRRGRGWRGLRQAQTSVEGLGV